MTNFVAQLMDCSIYFFCTPGMISSVHVSRYHVSNFSYVPFFAVVFLLLVLGIQEFICEICNGSCVVVLNICFCDVQ